MKSDRLQGLLTRYMTLAKLLLLASYQGSVSTAGPGPGNPRGKNQKWLNIPFKFDSANSAFQEVKNNIMNSKDIS